MKFIAVMWLGNHNDDRTTRSQTKPRTLWIILKTRTYLQGERYSYYEIFCISMLRVSVITEPVNHTRGEHILFMRIRRGKKFWFMAKLSVEQTHHWKRYYDYYIIKTQKLNKYWSGNAHSRSPIKTLPNSEIIHIPRQILKIFNNWSYS